MLVLIFASAFIAFESVDKLLRPSPVSEQIIIIVATIGFSGELNHTFAN